MKKHHRHLEIILICLTSLNLQAQFWKSTHPNFQTPLFGGSIQIVNDSVAWTWASERDTSFMFTFLNNSISKTADGGTTWQPAIFPSSEPGIISSMFGISAENAWLTYVDFTNGNKVQKTSDGGLTWQSVNVDLHIYVDFIYMWNDQEGIIIGDPDSLGMEAYKTFDGGNTWERILNIPSQSPEEVFYGDNYKVINNEIWFSTSNARVFHSPDRGITWETWNGPVTDMGWVPWTMDVDNEENVYLIFFSDDFMTTIAHHLIYRTGDSGQTWENITPTDNQYFPRDICAVPGSDALVATFGSEFENFTRISYDDGDSWLEVDAGDRANLLSFYSPQIGYASDHLFAPIWSPTVVYKYAGSPLTGLIENNPLPDIDIIISPNPVSANTNIKVGMGTPNDVWVLLNSDSGRLLKKEVFHQVSHLNFSLDMTSFPSGTYFITIANKNGVKTQKIIKV